MTIVVLVDRVAVEQAVAAAGSDTGPLDVLAFAGAGELAGDFVSAMGTRIRTVLSTRNVMREAVPAAREKFVRFTAEWAARPVVFGRDFRDGFRRGGRSAWWFTDLSNKNAGTRPTFSRLCELEALSAVLAKRPYDRAVLVGRDRDQAAVLSRVCARANVGVTVAPRPTTVDGVGFLKLALGRAKRMVLDAAATVLALRRRLPSAINIDGNRRSIGFCTFFPSQWRTWHGAFRDRYYVDVPDIVQRQTGWQPFYVCVLPAPSLRALRSNADAAARLARDAPGTMVFLERWASVWDVCRIHADVRAAFKYWWLESFDRPFRRSFTWDGIDIFPLVRHDLRASMVRDLPYFELLARRVQRMIASVRPSDLVLMLETYPHGRALMWGARAANTGIRLIGFQHSVVNANQLMYRFMPSELADLPLPDVFLLYGENAKGMLRASGVPERRLVVTGARRFDDLIEFRRRRREARADLRRVWEVNDHTRIVVVATNYWTDMSRRLVKMCGDAIGDRPDTLIIVKPHPNHRLTENDLRLPPGARARLVATDRDLNELQAAADVMVGAMGTSDAEALVIGCPVVRVALTHFDLSPTSDVPGAGAEVATAVELREAIEAVFTSRPSSDYADELVERAFFRLDGRAGDRVIGALSALDPAQASVPA